MAKAATSPAAPRLTKERLVMALRATSAERSKHVAAKVVDRAAEMLGCSPTAIRKWIRRDADVRAAKLEADAAWRAVVDANLQSTKLRLRGRSREALEAAERAAFKGRFGFDFACLDTIAQRHSTRLRRSRRQKEKRK